ncbi:MAG: sulfurtransferase TusA family protein [Parvularcula sp.]
MDERAPIRLLDTRGLRCPLPVIRMETRLRHLGPGETLEVISDDPIARLDIPLAAERAGFECSVVAIRAERECVFRVTRSKED